MYLQILISVYKKQPGHLPTGKSDIQCKNRHTILKNRHTFFQHISCGLFS